MGSFEESIDLSEVARRNGLALGLLTVWRHQVAAAEAGNAPNSPPIQNDTESTSKARERMSLAKEISRAPIRAWEMIKLELSGTPSGRAASGIDDAVYGAGGASGIRELHLGPSKWCCRHGRSPFASRCARRRRW
ncbi:hypothetical protein H8B02_20405 [Bradyrhizobium sp. Pear77]|nr:hypothetical protein [Bradyrhizobium altum]MCC8968105.1 hypothetical protein [Bradyrhizobium oropedii]